MIALNTFMHHPLLFFNNPLSPVSTAYMCMIVETSLEHGQPISGSTPKEDVSFPHTPTTPQPVNANGTYLS